MIEFTDEWMMHKGILGEGAYGEVKLIVNRKTDEKVACKIINYGKNRSENVATNVNKEVAIHKLLSHENIIRYFGRRKEALREYIYLEYASRGELFQMIEPDVGMQSSLAQLYMKQLLSGLRYLHTIGIVHRDLKPENLLIHDDGTLKISDFGMATLFRSKGKERLLDRRCGTKPYCAPEVLLRPYRAQPADIWSCGIILIAMLTGELPWADSVDSIEFVNYKNDSYLTVSPWSKLGNATLSLVRKILVIQPEKRLTIEKILEHPWMKFEFEDPPVDVVDAEQVGPVKRFNSMMETETRIHRSDPVVALSQPMPNLRPNSIDQLVTKLKPKRDICFSQPAQNDDLFLSSQLHFSQSPVTKENFQNLIKRLTRFYVTTNYEKTLELLSSILDTFHYTWQFDEAGGAVTISTVDAMKNQLVFKANIIEIQGKVLVDFRLAKGCGIDFRKKFKKLKECLVAVVDVE